MKLKLAYSVLADSFFKWNAGYADERIDHDHFPGQAARVVQTLTADLSIGLHTNQPHADSQRSSMTI